MKLFLSALLLMAAAGALKVSQPAKLPSADAIKKYKLKNAVRCSPDLQQWEQVIEEADIPLMPGAGKYTWTISTKNDSAQLYFNQGINMYYGFHIIEAVASFKKAAKFDAENPMIWWAQALAYGPNINDVAYSVLPQALEAVNKANALINNASPVEKELIKTISARYSTDTTLTREKLNSDYTSAMRSAYAKFPANADIAALYADAMMLEHPWDLWNINKTPKPWTPRIREVLENTLSTTREHPGLNHYYIHVMEASPVPEKALASAGRLGNLNPGLSHLVHMPSHIYLRTGYYTKGYLVNEEALKQYDDYLRLYPAVSASEFLYRLHNEHMLINCAMHAGRKQYSTDKALNFKKTIAPYLSEPGAMGNYLGYMYSIPTLTMIRFDDWEGLLNAAPVDSPNVYAQLLSHFGRGMAYTHKNNMTEAEHELAVLNELIKDTVLSLSFAPFSSAIEGAEIAKNLLQGTISLKEKNFKKAIDNFSAAVERENNMVYNEPRDWLLNPKWYLANACLRAGRFKEAEKTFLKDLQDNKENVWSLDGLHKTLKRQNRNAEAIKVSARLKKAAVNSDLHFSTEKST